MCTLLLNFVLLVGHHLVLSPPRFMRQAGGQVGWSTEEQHKRTSMPCLQTTNAMAIAMANYQCNGYMLPQSFSVWPVSWISLGQVTCLPSHHLCFLGQRGQVGGEQSGPCFVCQYIHLSASQLGYQWFTNIIVVIQFMSSAFMYNRRGFLDQTKISRFSKNIQFKVFHE